MNGYKKRFACVLKLTSKVDGQSMKIPGTARLRGFLLSIFPRRSLNLPPQQKSIPLILSFLQNPGENFKIAVDRGGKCWYTIKAALNGSYQVRSAPPPTASP
jgi:hypothetical protein